MNGFRHTIVTSAVLVLVIHGSHDEGVIGPRGEAKLKNVLCGPECRIRGTQSKRSLEYCRALKEGYLKMRWGWKKVMMGYHCGNVDGVVFVKGRLKY